MGRLCNKGGRDSCDLAAAGQSYPRMSTELLLTGQSPGKTTDLLTSQVEPVSMPAEVGMQAMHELNTGRIIALAVRVLPPGARASTPDIPARVR